MHQFSIDPNSFGTRQNDEKEFIVSADQSIGALVSFKALKIVAGKFSLCHCPTHQYFIGGQFADSVFCFKSNTLESFVKIEVVVLILADIDIPNTKPPLVFEKLDVYLVKFIQVLCISIRLKGNIIVGDRRSDLDAISKIPIQLKVKA